MAASITDRFTEATNGTRPSPTTLTGIKTIGAASLSAAALTGWPTATAVHFILYTIDTSGAKVAGSQSDWKGVVSGTSITNLVLKAGTDSNYAIGTVVECAPTAAWANDMADGLLVEHNPTGTHGAITATSVTTNTMSASGANHISLSAGASKLVKTTVLRQDDTTNTYQVGNTVILTGWGVMTPGVVSFVNETVNFGVTFLQRPIVTIAYGGDNASATTYGSGGANILGGSASARSITTTSFLAGILSAGGNWAAGNTVFYQWTAIGEI